MLSVAIVSALATSAFPAWADFEAPFPISPANQEATAGDAAIGHALYVLLTRQQVLALVIPPGATPGPKQVIAPADSANPQVAVDADGDALIVYERSCGSSADTCIYARTHSAGGALGAPQKLSGPGCAEPQVAAGTGDDMVVAWRCVVAGRRYAQALARLAEVFGSRRTVSPGNVEVYNVRADIDSAGNAIVVWEGYTGTNNRIQSRTLFANNTLGPLQNISPAAGFSGFPQIAVGSDDKAVIAWERVPEFAGVSQVEARTRSSAGALGAKAILSEPDVQSLQPQVAVDGSSNALVVWVALDESLNGRINGRHRSATGALGPIQNISTSAGSQYQPQVARNSDGEAAVIWTQEIGGVHRVVARRRAASGALGQIEVVSAGPLGLSPSPQIAIDDAGDVQTIFRRYDGSVHRIWAAYAPAEP